MENNRYRNINELLAEVESLGDWRDVSQRDKFFRILSKITVIYNGYKTTDEKGKTSTKWYPSEVMDAIVEACRGKFPTSEEAFFKFAGKSQLRPGCPDYSNYLVLVQDPLSISLMGERTRIDEIAKNDFGIDVYNTPSSQDEVEELISSSKEYIDKVHEQQKAVAEPIEFHGSTLEECVNSLLKFKKRGESVVVNFNGHQLYSCDITMDSAFQEVTGKTKDEFNRAQQEYMENLKKEQAEKRAAAIEKIPYWMEKGSDLIYPERMEDWKKYVEASAREGMYHGMDIDATIELMEMLENGSLEDAKKLINEQGHSGWSYGIVRRNIFEFSSKGPEFWEYTAEGEIDAETRKALDEKKKENAKLEALYSQKDEVAEEKEPEDPYKEQKYNSSEVMINYRYGNTIESAVKTLQDYKARGESVYIEFNGHRLYSCDVTMDSAYQEITGKTKAEFDKAQEEWRKEYKERQAREEAEAKAKIPAWVEKGTSITYPERMEDWKKCVEARAGDLYHGMDLDSAIQLMEMLDSGASMEDVKKTFDEQGHSGASAGMVRRILFHFSKKGPEFYESTAWGELSDEDKQAIADKKKENAELDELHKADSTKEIPEERRSEEQEITDAASEKEQLTSEISSIEQQIAQLKSQLQEKQSKLNELEEK